MANHETRIETCPECNLPAHASETTDDGRHPNCVGASTLYHICDVTLSCPGRGRFSLPAFAVWASSSDHAAWIAERIVLCDRRTSDGALWRLEGAIRRESEAQGFVIQMTDDGPRLSR